MLRTLKFQELESKLSWQCQSIKRIICIIDYWLFPSSLSQNMSSRSSKLKMAEVNSNAFPSTPPLNSIDPNFSNLAKISLKADFTDLQKEIEAARQAINEENSKKSVAFEEKFNNIFIILYCCSISYCSNNFPINVAERQSFLLSFSDIFGSCD